MKILVTEIQTYDGGAISTPSYAYDDRNKAEAKYHAVLSAAAVSKLPLHACIMYQADGRPIKYETFTHEAEPEEGADE